MAPKWLKKNVPIIYFTKNLNKFKTFLIFAHIAAMSRPEFETQWSDTETETRLWRYETETRPRLRKMFLETCLEVSTSGCNEYFFKA